MNKRYVCKWINNKLCVIKLTPVHNANKHIMLDGYRKLKEDK